MGERERRRAFVFRLAVTSDERSPFLAFPYISDETVTSIIPSRFVFLPSFLFPLPEPVLM